MSSEFLDEHTYSVINRYLAVFDTHRHLIYCVRYFKTHINGLRIECSMIMDECSLVTNF